MRTTIRLLGVLLIAVGVLWLGSGAPVAQQPSPAPGLKATLSIHATTLAELRTWDAFVTGESRAGTLRLRSAVQDPLLPTRTLERYDQFYEGLRVWGRDVVRDSERGVPISVFGLLAQDLSLSVVAKLNEAAAVEALQRRGGSDAVLMTTPELVVLPLDSGEYRLAYNAVVSAKEDVVRLFIDAQTGAELMRYSEIQRQQPAVGTGTGVLGDTKKLSVENRSGTYFAFDRHRPPTIETFDMRGNLARTKALFSGQLPYLTSDLATNVDNIWTDVAVVDAHVHVSWTYDYYFKRFGRNGLDGRNGPIDIVVNAVSQQGALSLSSSDLNYALNASWCGVCGPGRRGRMFFGSGIPAGVSLVANGRNYTYFSGALDIAAHELTHAVTEATSSLIYRNESGSLNEAFSDMMGKSVEFYYHPLGSGVGQADYVIGKDISRAVRAGSLNGERSMANPALYGDPDHYSKYKHLPNDSAGDNGGVHTNSGIPNHVFYLAIEGGTNRSSGLSVQGVGAANREQIEKVFYRAFTLLMPASSLFVTARTATIQSSRDLYGPGGIVERAVTQAWDAVGVIDSASVGTFTGSVPVGRSVQAIITMPSSGFYSANLTWGSLANNDLDFYVTPVNCLPLTPSGVHASCILSSSESEDAFESVGVPVRAGEQYWLTVNNFRGGSTAFTVRHWISPVAGSSSSSSLVAPQATPFVGYEIGPIK